MITDKQIYSTYSEIKYPFSDTHEYDVTNDIVLDMCLTVPSSIPTPYVTVVSVTANIFFLAIETGGPLGVGFFSEVSPSPFTVYDMTSTMAGCYGWILLGPGCSRPYENRSLTMYLDESVLARNASVANMFSYIDVDGFRKAILGGPVTLTSNGNIKMSRESRTVSGTLRDCLVLSRNDSLMTRDIVYGQLVEGASSDEKYASSIGGVSPDSSGNIDILFGYPGASVTTILDKKDDGVAGLLIDDASIIGCTHVDPVTMLSHSKCDEGLDYPLPLDADVEKAKSYEEDCGCPEPESASTNTESS